MNEKRQDRDIIFQREKEMKSIRNHKQGVSSDEKHNKVTQRKARSNLKLHPQIPGRKESQSQPQNKLAIPGENRLTILPTE
jgi:hypothetical protein